MKLFRAYADSKRHLYCEVRVFSSRIAMLRDIYAVGFGVGKMDKNQQGQCSGLTHYRANGKLSGKFACMWLNEKDLSDRPNEITSHEATHAAMRYAANKKADLSNMEGEEVLCHAQGVIQKNLVIGLYRTKVFPPVLAGAA